MQQKAKIMYWDIDTSNTIVKERLEQAERDHLAQEAMLDNRAKGYNPTLAWVGQRMQAIGLQLTRMAGEQPRASADLN